MKASQMAFLDERMRWKTEKGDMEIQVGSSSEDIRLKGMYRVAEDGYVKSPDRGFYADVEAEKARWFQRSSLRPSSHVPEPDEGLRPGGALCDG